jgi:hypothetical protein
MLLQPGFESEAGGAAIMTRHQAQQVVELAHERSSSLYIKSRI